MAYCATNARKLSGLLKNPADPLKYKWDHAQITNASGWTAMEMLGPVKAFVEAHKHEQTPDGGGGHLFPANMPCIVFDNLNACFQDKGSGKCFGRLLYWSARYHRVALHQRAHGHHGL
eukprot:7237194-Heterocapsa_arctica.AAC.1